MIFHERDSQGRFLELLKTCPPPAGSAVIHCFSGTRSELTRYLDMGYYIGITGILTLRERGEFLRRLVPQIRGISCWRKPMPPTSHPSRNADASAATNPPLYDRSCKRWLKCAARIRRSWPGRCLRTRVVLYRIENFK